MAGELGGAQGEPHQPHSLSPTSFRVAWKDGKRVQLSSLFTFGLIEADHLPRSSPGGGRRDCCAEKGAPPTPNPWRRALTPEAHPDSVPGKRGRTATASDPWRGQRRTQVSWGGGRGALVARPLTVPADVCPAKSAGGC